MDHPQTTARPWLTLIFPCYNEEKRLPASLSQVREYLDRLDRPYEILVVDDGSRDETGEIARSYGERITYYRQPRNRGQFGNVNDGIGRARGR